jgi:hypothetical protein
MGQDKILLNEVSLNKANEFVCLSMTRFNYFARGKIKLMFN